AGRDVMSFGEAACCRMLNGAFSCQVAHRKAGEQARELGEGYIFACRAGLNHIAYPLTDGETLLGTVLLGPFLMDADAVEDEFGHDPQAYAAVQILQVLEPRRVTSLGRMMDYMFQSILPAERAILMRSRQRAAGQSSIGEALQMYKNQAVSSSYEYFYEKELRLLVEVRTGDMAQAKALINDLLGYVLFSEGWNASAVRLRAIELTTLLSRVALDGGANADSIFRLNEHFLDLISRQSGIEEISLLLLDVAESFMSAMFNQTDKGNLHIRKALRFIAAHYAEPIRISDAAAELGLSPDYFATLFRQTVGESFNSYLMRIRIEQSKLLLLSTDDALTDIAVATGFSDQSYFCRIFKKHTGISPGKYRR
ncbi:MAG: helix-turn-helix domain-containing protein, partial [Clostridia bacterium]|nr:helix-turn-helix domain-containing protein [Clostridia bacterium]